MLKTYLNKTLGAALEQGEHTLTQKRWERHAEPPAKLKDMLHEIKEGEKAFKNLEDETHRVTLREMLGLSASTPFSELEKEENVISPPPSPAASAHARNQRVGQRQPKRDVVGKESPHAE